MPGSWPEPFGLVAIEALACGAPVLARRVGGLDEIIRDGVDGFFGDDVTQLAFLVDRVAELDRAAIRASVIDRFSATRMADGYEALYARMLGARRPATAPARRRAAADAGGVDGVRRSEQAAGRRQPPAWPGRATVERRSARQARATTRRSSEPRAGRCTRRTARQQPELPQRRPSRRGT